MRYGSHLIEMDDYLFPISESPFRGKIHANRRSKICSQALVKAESTKVQLETSAGTIVLELNDEKAPKTVANFLQYVESDHYAGTVFHRVIKGFMIQGGGMDADLKEKPTKPPVVNEGGKG